MSNSNKRTHISTETKKQTDIQEPNEQVLSQAFYKVFKDVFSQHGFVYNQISSYDNFLGKDGIHNILENMFKIYNFMPVENNPKVKSIKIEVSFENSKIEEQQIVDETIYDVKVNENKVNGINFPRTQDINLPVNCRNYLRTLKVNVFSDINIKLTSYSGPVGQGSEVATKQQTLKHIQVAEIPLMMGSKFCSLSKKSIEEKIKLQEDPLDLGGYFIIKGNEWSLDFTESFKMNELQIKNIAKNKTVECFVLSKNGDGFEISFQVTIIYQYKLGKIMVRLEQYERIQYVEIPFYVIFKIFGITNHMEMTEMIIQDDVNSQTEIAITLKKLIQQATNAEYEIFENANQWTTSHQTCQELSNILNRDEYKRTPVDKYLTYDAERLKNSFYEFFLPHLGQTGLSNTIKMRYFGMQIKKALMAYLTGEVADQHTYQDKRIHATGQNLSKQFKKTFNHIVIAQMKKKLFQELEHISDITRVDVGSIISAQLSNHIQLKTLQKAITTGSGSELPKSGIITIKSSIQSQRLIRKNELNSVCQMRMINNKKQSLDKQSKEILRQRSVQPSFAGYICIVESSANGEKAGKLKSLSSLAIITNSESSKTIIAKLWEILEPYEIMYDLDAFSSKYIAEYNLQSVYVNGFWVGFIQNSQIQRAATILRTYRRNNYHEWKYITVYVNEDMDLYVYSDYGRILVPLVIVHYDEEGNPYHKLDPDNLKRIMSGKGTIDWYLEQQILEYVSVEEAHNCLVAESPSDYLSRSNPERSHANIYKFTHIMIPQSLLGIAALLSPFMNHAQTKRITMFTGQAKQGCGWAMYNYPYRMDKGTLIQQYIAQPLVKTIIHDFFPPDGTSMIVAYTVYDGQNQEDSVIANSGSVDQGLFNGMYYTFVDTQIKGQEDITPISFTQPPNKKGNYTKLQNGIIQIGTWVEKNDVLVAKKQPQRLNEPEHDTSLLYKDDEPACVEDVHIVQDEQNVINIRIKLRTTRNLKQGDKLSSCLGCKAVISQFLPIHEMPFTADQLVPDIIFNPHSIPTRMMIGQLIESSFERICAEMCDTIDGTAFSNTSVQTIRELMEEYKIEDQGYKYLYNGQTGERIKAKIFIVPTFYYRLQKFAITGKYVVDDANKDILSRQPLQNRKEQGGSRLGEMEKDSFYSSGTSSILQEKFYEHSDSFNMKVCKNCGMLAEFNSNPNYNVYQCSTCRDNAEIVNVQSSWCSLLFQQTIKSMQLDMKFNFEEPEIEQYI